MGAAVNASAAERAAEAGRKGTERKAGSVVAGLPRPTTLCLNALRLQLEARLAPDDGVGHGEEGYPASGNVEWFSPPGGCIFLAIDLERCLGRSPSGRSVLVAKAAFRARVYSADGAQTPTLDIALSLSCVRSALRSEPVSPPGPPPALPAAVEANPAWPHAWRAATMSMRGENVGVIFDRELASGDGGAADDETEDVQATLRKRRKLQRVVLPKGRPIHERSRLKAAASQRLTEQRQKNLLGHRMATVQALKTAHDTKRQAETRELHALHKRLVEETQDLGLNRGDQVKQQMKLWQAMHACTDTDGRRIIELFEQLPDRNQYPDYYAIIKQPVSLQCILKRIQASRGAEALPDGGKGDDEGWYTTMQDFMSDVLLVFANAREYNMEGSEVYNDADTLEDVVTKAYKKLQAQRLKLATKSVATALPLIQMRRRQEAAEQQRKNEIDRAVALLTDVKEKTRTPSASQLQHKAAVAFAPPPPTAAELGLPSAAEFGLQIVEPPSRPRSSRLRLKTKGTGEDGEDSSEDDDKYEYEYDQLLGELLASVPESAGALDAPAKQEASRLYDTATGEMQAYEQAVAKALERSAARAAAA